MNYAAYFAIEKDLKQKGFDLDRSELINLFTEGKKNGLSEMNHFEYAEFLRWLNTTFQNKQVQQANQKERENQMRRKIIALFHKMGYKLANGQINMKLVNDWCVKYGHKHMELNAYNYNELTTLLHQAEQYYKTFIEGL